jgi:hypothetical protein
MKHDDIRNAMMGSQFDDIIKKTTKNVEWETYKTDGGTKSYPFWKAAIAGPTDTFKDFEEWLKKTRKTGFKDTDMTGAVKPKAEFDLDNTTKPVVKGNLGTEVEKSVKELEETPKAVEMKDMTGAVKPKADMVKNKKVDVKPTKEKAGDMKDMTGVVEPKSDVKVNKIEEIPESKLKKGDLKDLTGAVKPESEFGGKAKPEIHHDFSEPTEPIILSEWGMNILDVFKKLDIKD